jgi:hypothetical protein
MHGTVVNLEGINEYSKIKLFNHSNLNIKFKATKKIVTIFIFLNKLLKINSFKIFDVTKNFLTQNFYPSHTLHSIKFLHPHCNVTRKRKLRSKISTFHSISHLGGDRLPFLAYNIFF